MLLNSANLHAAFTGFRTIFNGAFQGVTPTYEQVAMTVPSATESENYGWLKDSTAFREWIGDRVLQNLGTADYAVKNKPYENTVAIPASKIEDDTYGVYKPLFAQLGQDAKMHPDELVYGLLSAGLTTACYDGQNFFDVDHPVLAKDGSMSSASNYQAGTGKMWVLIDNTRMIKPLIYQLRRPYRFISKDKPEDDNVFYGNNLVYGVDTRCNVGFGLWQLAYASKAELNETNYGAVRAAMLGMKGDKGKVLGIRPKLLLVPPSLEGVALKIVRAEIIDSTTNVYRDTATVLSVPWLE